MSRFVGITLGMHIMLTKGKQVASRFRAPNFIHEILYNVINDALKSVDSVNFLRTLRVIRT